MRSRREFVKALGAGSVLLAADGKLGWAATPGADAGQAKVWATVGEKRHAAQDALSWKPLGYARADAIFVDSGTTKQDILGFGGAMTDATCYLLGRMPADRRSALMHDLFAPDAMALNVCRTTIGSSDYSVSPYTYDESAEPDPELKKFSIDHDRAYILPMLKEARQVNPELFLFSSPWSPPGWMKAGGKIFGGSMRARSFGPYASIFTAS